MNVVRMIFVCLLLTLTIYVAVIGTETTSSTSSSLIDREQQREEADDVPEGYYAFIESPNAEPPRVRPPPYSQVQVDCKTDDIKAPYASYSNLCGDLNKGVIPINPMGQNVMGSSYPFVLIKNMTLRYLSKTLPILKADETLPKVAQIDEDYISENTITSNDRVKRSQQINLSSSSKNVTKPDVKPNNRQSKKFCDQGGVFCMLYKAINGDPKQQPQQQQPQQQQLIVAERRDDQPISNNGGHHLPKYEGPPTPCPAKVEYATPVFAKNYQGLWRYVVQIPYEGYFTQTVEVTRCVQSRCHYLDGGCLSTPRWSSLLVAEIYYPESVLTNQETRNPQRSPISVTQPPSVQDFQNYQQYLHKRAGLQASSTTTSKTTTTTPQHCDGVDSFGCFQVRLYYDWFLIPGSCKCWRPDYFNKYVRRKSNNGVGNIGEL